MIESSPVIFETDYNEDTASHLREEIENRYSSDKSTDKKARQLLIDYPTVYVITDPTKGPREKYNVYVGETNDIQRRTIQHIAEDPKTRQDFLAFKKSSNAHMYVIGHKYFNKSMTLDIENRLMQYMSVSPAVEHLNNRRNNDQNEYYDYEQFNPLFEKVWGSLHYRNSKLFPLQEIVESSALFKASPFNKLTAEQLEAKALIINKVNSALVSAWQNPEQEGKLILVKGDAGSGKTVLISSIFYDLVSENQRLLDEKHSTHKLNAALIVNQNEQLTVYQQIARKLGIGDKNNVLKPSTFINKTDSDHKVDIAFIDEAHLLLTQNSQSFAKKYGDNMLQSILKRAKVVVAVFDPMQVLSVESVWNTKKLEWLDQRAGENNIITLKKQMRIQASQSTVNWLNELIHQDVITPLPKDSKYEVKVFDSPAEMEQAIDKKNDNQEYGISRMVATFDWDYSGGKTKPDDGDYWSVKVGKWSMPWNYEINQRDHFEGKHRSVAYKDLSWAEKDYTLNEIGSTYTVQGSDLNFVGVVLGPSVKYRDGRIIHDPAGSKNPHATNKRHSTTSYAKELLKNEFNVLMTRGVHGLYIYAVDPELQAALKKAVYKA
jgi:DUF2075 family protein